MPDDGPGGPLPAYKASLKPNVSAFYPFIPLSLYPFIDMPIEAVGWRHYVPYPTYT